MAKPIETLSPTDEAIFRTATLKSLQGAAGDPDRIGVEHMPENAVCVNTGGSTVRYLRINADDSVSELSLSQLLTDLTPNRLLYINDYAGTFFNGTNTEQVGVIPLTAAQSVVGTKIRLRGFVKIGWQGSFPIFNGDCMVSLVFNVASNSANASEGVVFILNATQSTLFHVDAQLELVAGASGKYKVGALAAHPIHCLAIRDNAATTAFWSDTTSSLYVIDPTTEQNVGSTEGIVVQVQSTGGSTNLSLCNLWIDLNYEIDVP
jgi:hypothetical protein